MELRGKSLHVRYANRDRLKNAGASIKGLPSLINEQMTQRKEGRKKPLPTGSMRVVGSEVGIRCLAMARPRQACQEINKEGNSR